ncbi:MAG: aminopeptidase P family protein [Candidatus Aenigmarchaeota archaeon]|nr:aminopeptidase P family protein [Candidatus Aenigmarchaeota archaeon]
MMRVISKRKIKEFRRKLQENNIDVAIFINTEGIKDVNIRYFTGFPDEESFSMLTITQDKIKLFLTSLTYDLAKAATVDEVIKKNESISKILGEFKNKTIGIVEENFPFALSKRFNKKRIKSISNIIYNLRAVKEKKELELIKKACNITNKGIKFIEDNLHGGMRERDIALALEDEMKNSGAEEMSFKTIVTSSKRSWLIHPYPSYSKKKITRGLGLIDFGVKYKGYCSDVTVPFYVGKLNEKEKKILNTVMETYEKCKDSLQVGMPTWEINNVATKSINEHGFEFKHIVGHGIGLEVHDFPLLAPKGPGREMKIKNGMVFTMEPGVYEVGVGGLRIENDIMVKGNKFKFLTKSRLLKI